MILKVFWVYSRVKQIITEKWNISCHVSKQRMSQSSAIAASMDGELVSPENNTCHPAAVRLQPLLTVSPEGTQDLKTQDASWEAYQRNDFSKPRLLHLPTHRKVLGSLTWDIWFSLIYSNLMTLHYLPSVAKLLYSLAAPLASLEQLSQGYLRCCLLGLSPKNFHRIKYNSTFILIFWGNQVHTVGERRWNYY